MDLREFDDALRRASSADALLELHSQRGPISRGLSRCEAGWVGAREISRLSGICSLLKSRDRERHGDASYAMLLLWLTEVGFQLGTSQSII